MKTIAALLLGLAACGHEHGCDYRLHGVCVAVEAADPATKTLWSSPEMQGEVEQDIETGLAFWALPWTDLQGWTVLLRDREVECGCTPRMGGCTDPDERTIAVYGVATYFCQSGAVRATQLCPGLLLLHELGHIKHLDPLHREADWGPEQDMRLEATVLCLTRRTGYGC